MEILFIGLLFLLPLAIVVIALGMIAKALESIKQSKDEYSKWKNNR